MLAVDFASAQIPKIRSLTTAALGCTLMMPMHGVGRPDVEHCIRKHYMLPMHYDARLIQGYRLHETGYWSHKQPDLDNEMVPPKKYRWRPNEMFAYYNRQSLNSTRSWD